MVQTRTLSKVTGVMRKIHQESLIDGNNMRAELPPARGTGQTLNPRRLSRRSTSIDCLRQVGDVVS